MILVSGPVLVDRNSRIFRSWGTRLWATNSQSHIGYASRPQAQAGCPTHACRLWNPGPVRAQTLSMTARDEILAVLPAVRARTGRETFTPQEVIDELQRRGTSYRPSTIRTHIVSRMCANAPDHHARTYDDLERVGDGQYRRR